MKIDRHAKILQIIEEKNIETQEELAEELRARGIEVTQATVSRDIKELRLVKVLSAGGISKYAYLAQDQKGLSDKLIRVFSESVTSIDYANNLIVIKTIVAGAQAAASVIDAMNCKDIVGSIAGDDTILVVTRSNEVVEDVIKRFNQLMR